MGVYIFQSANVFVADNAFGKSVRVVPLDSSSLFMVYWVLLSTHGFTGARYTVMEN